MIQYPASDKAPRSFLPFSPATQVGDLIFVSGQASVSPTGEIIPGTFEEECRRSFENLKAVLENSGSDLKHVVKVHNFLGDPDHLKAYNEIYREFFSPPYPARTTITSCLPPTLKFEVDCIAVPKGKKSLA